ncbi:hypothetical protein FQA39_LY08152 [Lamprigera yunnana]|nr:hypothetical protein FQA39_LY08152 [Lamprigera yunnana]
MVLQEIAVKKGWQFPQYNLLLVEKGTPETEFHCEVKIASVVGLGVAKSKQAAKHEAARVALEKLIELNANTPDETLFKSHHLQVADFTTKVNVNYIGILNEMCVNRRIALPIFVEVLNPHCNGFTYECKVDSISTQAIASSKKQAKQLAAKDMIERTQALLKSPEHCEVSTSSLTSEETLAIKLYKNSNKKKKKPVNPNSSGSKNVETCYTHFMNRVKENRSKLSIMKKYLHKRDEETLKELLELIDLDYCIQTLEEDPCVVVLCINTEVPFSVLAHDFTYEECLKKVVEKTFDDLDILLNQ